MMPLCLKWMSVTPQAAQAPAVHAVSGRPPAYANWLISSDNEMVHPKQTIALQSSHGTSLRESYECQMISWAPSPQNTTEQSVASATATNTLTDIWNKK